MVTFKGDPIELVGSLPIEQETVKDFELVSSDLKRISLSSFEGKIKILHVFPSLDTGVCEKSVLSFQEKLVHYSDAVLIHISKDLPFAQSRFCLAKELKKAHILSAFDSTFGQDYGLLIKTGPLKGLLARSVFLINEKNQLMYHELVHEITQEPNYGALIENLEKILNPQ